MVKSYFRFYPTVNIEKTKRGLKKELSKGYKLFPLDIEERTILFITLLQYEPNCLLLGNVLSKEEKSETEIARDVIELGVDIKLEDPRQYLRQFLFPARLITFSCYYESADRGHFCYYLTKEGIRYGKRVAQFTLEFTIQNAIVLGDIFGKDGKLIFGKARRRYKILKSLHHSGGTKRQEHLAIETGTEIGMLKHDLEIFISQGIVETESSEVTQHGFSIYRWLGGDKDPDQVIKNAVARSVARKIKQNRQLSLRDLVVLTGYQTGEVINALFNLIEKKIIGGEDSFPIGKKVEFSLTESGKKLFEYYCIPLSNQLGR